MEQHCHDSEDIANSRYILISRRDAIKEGMTRYHTGKPCANGHIAPRKVHSCACVECARILTNRSRHPGLNGEAPPQFKNRSNLGVSSLVGQLSLFDNSEIGITHLRKDYMRTVKRRVRKMGCEGFHTCNDISELIVMQGGLCGNHRCKCDLSKSGYQTDHIIPLARGGTNWPDNLQVLCPKCNASKGAKMPEDWDG